MVWAFVESLTAIRKLAIGRRWVSSAVAEFVSVVFRNKWQKHVPGVIIGCQLFWLLVHELH